MLIIKQNLLDENSTISIILIYGYLYGIVFFQIIFLIIINKYFKNLFNFFLVSLLFYNLYSLNVSISSEFTILPRYEKIFNISIYLVAFLFLIYFFFKNIKILKAVSIVYIFFNLFYLFNIQIYLNHIFEKNTNQVEFIKSKFKKKPNIYIYSIESYDRPSC